MFFIETISDITLLKYIEQTRTRNLSYPSNIDKEAWRVGISLAGYEEQLVRGLKQGRSNSLCVIHPKNICSNTTVPKKCVVIVKSNYLTKIMNKDAQEGFLLLAPSWETVGQAPAEHFAKHPHFVLTLIFTFGFQR